MFLSKKNFCPRAQLVLYIFRMNALRSVKNVLSMARRRSDDEDEERNLYGTSMDSDITTDGEGGGETAGEEGGANRTHDGERFGFIFFSAFLIFYYFTTM